MATTEKGRNSLVVPHVLFLMVLSTCSESLAGPNVSVETLTSWLKCLFLITRDQWGTDMGTPIFSPQYNPTLVNRLEASPRLSCLLVDMFFCLFVSPFPQYAYEGDNWICCQGALMRPSSQPFPPQEPLLLFCFQCALQPPRASLGGCHG